MWSALQGSILLWGLVLSVYIAAAPIGSASGPMTRCSAGPWSPASWLRRSSSGSCWPPWIRSHHVVGAIPSTVPGEPVVAEHPLVVIHPPLLYIGYVGFHRPVRLRHRSAGHGAPGRGLLVATRRWTVIAWASLTVGVVLGMWWSYQVLGWGGYWAWDPVENASLLPWLTRPPTCNSVVSRSVAAC